MSAQTRHTARRLGRPALLPVLCLALLAAGCDGNKDAELSQWIADVKARKGPRIEPLPEVKPYEPYTYVVDERRNPFTPSGSDRPEDRVAASASNGLKPDLNRNREALEGFPLDSLQMLGIIRIGASTYALVQAPDNIVYRASVGSYLGQNYGRINAINETEVALTELIPDGFGGWVKRSASLALEDQ